jgi:hypothetical protein
MIITKRLVIISVLIAVFSFGCATTTNPVLIPEPTADYSKASDVDLMRRFDSLRSSAGFLYGGVIGAVAGQSRSGERKAIEQELNRRGYVYDESKREAVSQEGYPYWVKKKE